MGRVALIIIVAAIAVAAVLVGLYLKSRSAERAKAAATAASSAPAPMSSLEAALDQATDRSGRKIRDRIDAEASVVDTLKVADDTGPVLRRALDRVEHHLPKSSPTPPAPPPTPAPPA